MGAESDFQGCIDLVRMKALTFSEKEVFQTEIPAEFAAAAIEAYCAGA